MNTAEEMRAPGDRLASVTPRLDLLEASIEANNHELSELRDRLDNIVGRIAGPTEGHSQPEEGGDDYGMVGNVAKAIADQRPMVHRIGVLIEKLETL